MKIKSKPIIIHYCNSPTRYLHGLVTEIDHQNLPFFYRLFLPFFKWWLKFFDLNAVNNLNKKQTIWVGNSKFCSQMIKDIYKTDSQTIYPPIELDYFFDLKRLYKNKTKFNLKLENSEKKANNLINSTDKSTDKSKILKYKNNSEVKIQSLNLLQSDSNLEKNTTKTENLENSKNLEELENLKLIQKLENEDYYYYFGRISFHKRIDLTILACLHLGKKLKICGASAFASEMEKLKNLVTEFEIQNPTKTGLIKFLGRLNDDKRDLYLQYCRAFIFPAKEDFGIAPVEVLASGVPIIAYKAGGALEYVIEKKIPNQLTKNQKVEQNSENVSKNINSQQNLEEKNEGEYQEIQQISTQNNSNENLTNNSEFDLKELEEFENSEDIEKNKNNFNGVFFQEQTVESLCNAILEFEKIETWNTDFIRQSVLKFDQKYFRQAIEKLVESNI